MKRIITFVLMIAALMSITVSCKLKHDVLTEDEVNKLRGEYPLCSRPDIPGVSSSIGSAGIDDCLKNENSSYKSVYAVVEFVEDKGTDEFTLAMETDSPEYKVNKQQGTPLIDTLKIHLLSVNITELICGNYIELPERIYDDNKHITLIYNEIILSSLPEFKEGDKYIMLLGILNEDADVRRKYINCPEIFAGEIYYITADNYILSTQSYRDEYSGLKLDDFKATLSDIYDEAQQNN